MKLTVEQAGRPYISIGVFIGTDEEDPQTIAYVSEHRNRKPRSAKETQAIIHLLCAAPRMLATLEYVLGRLATDDAESIAAVKESIALAKGGKA